MKAVMAPNCAGADDQADEWVALAGNIGQGDFVGEAAAVDSVVSPLVVVAAEVIRSAGTILVVPAWFFDRYREH